MLKQEFFFITFVVLRYAFLAVGGEGGETGGVEGGGNKVVSFFLNKIVQLFSNEGCVVVVFKVLGKAFLSRKENMHKKRNKISLKSKRVLMVTLSVLHVPFVLPCDPRT